MFEPLYQLWFRIRSRFVRDELDAELQEEIKQHAEFLREEAARNGASLDEAARTASRRLGNVTNIRERTRERWSFGWLETLLQDSKYAFRFLRRSPGFTMVAVLSLALGVGANATVFAVADKLMFSAPAKVENPGELFQMYVKREGMGDSPNYAPAIQFPEYFALREQAKSIAAVAVYEGPSRTKLGRGPDAVRVRRTLVTANYFSILGVQPLRGRFFLDEDEKESTSEYATVISYDFWRSHFNGADSAVGARIQNGGVGLVVVGITPREFSGTELNATDLWTPLGALAPIVHGPEWKTGFLVGPRMLVRLHGDVQPATASAEATVIFERLPGMIPGVKRYKSAQLGSTIVAKGPGTPSTEVQVSSRLIMASALVLLAACANLANLLLVRALTRRREIALRLAIGVSRLRLASQMVIESIIIAALGSGVALIVARWSGDALRTLVFPEMRWATAAVNAHVFTYSVVCGTLMAILATLIPAIRMTRSDVSAALRSSAPQLTSSTGRLRRGLLAVQVALAMLLIVGASAFSSSLKNAYQFNMGMDVNRLMTARYGLEVDSVATPSRLLLLQEAERRVRAIPGIEDAAIVSQLPLSDGDRNNLPIRILERVLPPKFTIPIWHLTPQLQHLVGFQLLRGRWFTEADVAPGMQQVVLVSQATANKLWPGQEAVGRCVQRATDSSPCLQVVGVIRDVRPGSFRDEAPVTMFMSSAAPRINSALPGYLVIRVREGYNSDDLLLPVRKAMLGIRNDFAAVEVNPLSKSLDRYYRPLELGTTMFGSFALLAVVLSALGLYGILAFSVAQRTNEFGIRAALGAQARDLVASVVREGMNVVAAGMLLGAILSWYASTAISALLFQSSARDVAPYLIAIASLGIVALAASLVPAWRATRVDPAIALRAE